MDTKDNNNMENMATKDTNVDTRTTNMDTNSTNYAW